MQVVSKYPDGVFSWIDLGTNDVDGAKAFYSGLFGWEYVDIPLGDMGFYSMCQIKGHNVAGMGSLPPDMAAQGVPPNWSSYVSHSNIDDIAAKISAAGGQVLFPPMDIFESGRMLMATDPAGAVFGAWQPKEIIGAQLVNMPNTLCWNELQTKELEASKEFYAKVFGWTYEEDQNGYVSVAVDGRSQAGMMKIDESWGPVPNNWSIYFLVDGIEEVAGRVSGLGGTVMVPVTPAGSIGNFAVIQDPQGAFFSIIEYHGEASPPPGY